MKMLKLNRPAWIAGAIRNPSDGIVRVEDDAEAEKLIASNLAEDVTADFTSAPSAADTTSETPQEA